MTRSNSNFRISDIRYKFKYLPRERERKKIHRLSQPSQSQSKARTITQQNSIRQGRHYAAVLGRAQEGKCMGTHFLPEVSSQGAQCRCYCWLWVEDQYTIPKCHSLLKRANRVRRRFKLDRSLKAELASRSLVEPVLYVCVRQGGWVCTRRGINRKKSFEYGTRERESG